MGGVFLAVGVGCTDGVTGGGAAAAVCVGTVGNMLLKSSVSIPKAGSGTEGRSISISLFWKLGASGISTGIVNGD
jgi:hypothetical protein